MEECGATFCSAKDLNRVFVQSAKKVDSRLGLGCSSSRSYLRPVIGSFTPITVYFRQSRFVNLLVSFLIESAACPRTLVKCMQFYDQIVSKHELLMLTPILRIEVINILIALTWLATSLKRQAIVLI